MQKIIISILILFSFTSMAAGKKANPLAGTQMSCNLYQTDATSGAVQLLANNSAPVDALNIEGLVTTQFPSPFQNVWVIFNLDRVQIAGSSGTYMPHLEAGFMDNNQQYLGGYKDITFNADDFKSPTAQLTLTATYEFDSSSNLSYVCILAFPN